MGRKDKPVVLNEGQGNTIGAFLRQQRQQQYISLTQMAALTGYSKTYLSAIENGNIRASRNVVKEYTRHLSLAPDRLPSAFQDPALTTPSDAIQERPWNVPYWRNPLFVGRSETLERLHNRLFSSSRKLSHILAVTGLGGIGKTQLVTEYAYQYRVYYQGIFWIRGDSSEVLFADFATLPLTTGLITEQAEPINVYNPSHTGDATKKWLRQHSPCLLIVDNLDDTQELSALARTTSQLGDTRVIITTRLQIPSQVAQVFELGNLDLDDSTLFLLRRINALPPDGQLADADPTQRILANEIAHIIDGIPLALDQAGSYIEETDCDLGRYLRLFKQQSSRLLNERGGFALDHPEPIATTWMLAFNKIQQHNATALDLLYLCAFVHPDTIYRELFQQGAPALNPILHETLSDPVTLDHAIGKLRKYSILRKTGQHDTFSLHRLVQSVIRDSLDKREQRIWAERAVRIINAIFPRITATDWIQTRTICRKYYVHAQVGLDIATHYQMGFPEVAQLLSKVGKYLDDTSEFNEAEKCYLRAIELGEFLIGVTPDQLTQDYTNLALLYENMEKYRQAEDYYKKAMSSRQSEIAAGNFTPAIQETLRNYTTFLMKFEQRKNEAARLRAHTTGQLEPCVRHLTINDDHPDIIYEHVWEIHNEQQGQKTGDYGGNTHYTSIVGATFQYTFTGFGIAILADTTSDQGIIDIYLDDRYVLRKDICHDAEHQPQTIVYHQERLDNGTHTLRGELISGTFALDAFAIFTYDEPLDD